MAKVTVKKIDEFIYELHMSDLENNNSFSNAFIEDFVNCTEELSSLEDAKVVVLTGGKDIFSSGASYEMLQNIADGEFAAKDILLTQSLLKLPIPIIAAMEGGAVGGGFTLGLSCDLIVAASEQRYGISFAEMGITPGMGTMAILPAIVGHHIAMEMILTTKYYRGQELVDKKIFNYVTTSDDVMSKALDLARRMSEKEKYVITMIKENLAVPRRVAIEKSISQEHLMHQSCIYQNKVSKIISENYLQGDQK